MTWGFLQGEDDLDAGRVTLPSRDNGYYGLRAPRPSTWKKSPRRYLKTAICDHCEHVGAWVFNAYGVDMERRCDNCQPGGAA